MTPNSHDDPNAQALTRWLGCSPQDLPTLPSSAWEISRLIAREDFSLDELAGIINQDPPLATRLLRLANSTMFTPRLGGEVTEVKKAVMMMGTLEVSQLALGLSVLTTLGSRHPLKERIKLLNLWEHSVAVGVIAETLAKEVLGLGPGFYVLGLVHDVGKIALSSNRPSEYLAILETLERDGLSCAQAEEESLLVDHAMVGGVLFTYWGLGDNLAAAARYHHLPWEAPEEHKKVAGVMSLANAVAKKLGKLSFEGKGFDMEQTPEWPRLWEFWQSLGWDPDKLPMDDLAVKLEEQMNSLGQGAG